MSEARWLIWSREEVDESIARCERRTNFDMAFVHTGRWKLLRLYDRLIQREISKFSFVRNLEGSPAQSTSNFSLGRVSAT